MSHISERAAKYLTENGVIAFKRIYVDVMGDVIGALFLSQLAYWQPRSKRNDGYIYKTYKEWKHETGLTRRQIKRVSDKAVELGIINRKLKRANSAPTLHYKLNYSELTKHLNAIITNCDIDKSAISESDKSAISLTETTTETTKDSSPSERKPKKKKERDSRIDHQAIKVFREVTRRHAPIVTRDMIISAVGDNSEKWRAHLVDWISRGYSPQNIKGMVDTFKNGFKEFGNGQHRQSAKKYQPNEYTAADYAAADAIKEARMRQMPG